MEQLTFYSLASSTQLLLQALFMFLALAALIVAAIYGIKFLHRRMSITSSNSMEVIDSLAIEPNKGIYLVRVLSSYYVIGVGESVKLLKKN